MRAYGSKSSGMSEVSPWVVSSFEADCSFWQAVDTAPCEGVSNFDISFFGWSWSRINCLPYGVGGGGGWDPLDESKSSSSELSESDIETSVGATGAAAATFLTFCGGPGKKKQKSQIYFLYDSTGVDNHNANC